MMDHLSTSTDKSGDCVLSTSTSATSQPLQAGIPLAWRQFVEACAESECCTFNIGAIARRAKKLLDAVDVHGAHITVKQFEAALREAKDAERYRYIRDSETLDLMVWEALEGAGSVNEEGELNHAAYCSGMDRAIDAAIDSARAVS